LRLQIYGAFSGFKNQSFLFQRINLRRFIFTG